MSERVRGKVAIVTGAARGQGASHAEVLCREGAAVVVGDILDDEGEALAGRLVATGADARYAHLDVSRREDWDAAIEMVLAAWGHVDVLVNNAGIVGYADAGDCSDEEWERVVAVNQTGVFLGMRAVLAPMLEQGSGSIVNISSTFGLNGAAGAFAYQATKGAVLSMTKGAAMKYGDAGIRVNAICPGVIETAMLDADIEAFGREGVDALVAVQAIKRFGVPQDTSNAVLYLASDEASFVTGAVLVVDGGYSAV